MRRIKLHIEYDGSSFHGWQKQLNPPLASVQQALEEAVTRMTGQVVDIIASGRTDAGVHATGMVAHFETQRDFDVHTFRNALNAQTGPEITIYKVEEVTEDFHARFSAIGRRYKYIIFNRRQMSPHWVKRAGHVRYELDFEKMQRAAQHLVGAHNFNAFRSSKCEAKSPNTEIYSLKLSKEGHFITAEIHGRAFLHNMIRIIMGTLVDIGRGKLPESQIQQALASHKREDAGVTLMPDGLYFTEAAYAEHEIISTTDLPPAK